MMRKHRLAVTAMLVVLVGALTALPALSVALQTAGTLPGGTSISVSITSPADGSVFLVPAGGTADVTVKGTAAVGAGVPLKNTTVVYSLDRSGSMSATAGVDCTGDAVNDARDTCAQVGITLANAAAAAATSAIKLTGLGSFADAGQTHNVDLGGSALLVPPNHDGNGNSIFDVAEVADTLDAIVPSQTNFAAGLQAAFTILTDPLNTSAVNELIFVSDADNQSTMVGANVSTLAGSVPANTTIHTFGIGVGPSCSFDGGTGSLDNIAALSTAGTGTCQIVTDMSKLADAIAVSLGSTLDSLQMTIDAGAPAAIPNSDISLPLPQPGPVSVTYSTPANDLAVGDHTICVIANGTDAGGTGSVKDCVTIHVVIQVSIDIKPGSDPNSINTKNQGVIPVAIFGSAGFDVSLINQSSLTFGRTGNEKSLQLRDHGVPNCAISDVNKDGYPDLVCHFETQLTGFQMGDTVGILKGMLTTGEAFQGSDAVRIVQ